MEEDFVEDGYVEPDEAYEFDANRFYDFTLPETDSEIDEAERWFEISGDYPHSPFVVKLNLEKILSPEVVANPSAKHGKNKKSISSSSSDTSTSTRLGVPRYAREKGSPMLLDTTKAKTKGADKFEPRSLSFMEPTVSHLAKSKQPKVHDEKHSNHLCARFQRTSAKLDQKSSVGLEKLATKRQKLEIGYLEKVTVPREPELETQLRAQRRSSKNRSASSESEKQKQSNYKTRPSNGKISQAHPLPQPRKSKPKSPDNFQNAQRPNRRSNSAKENRSSAGDKPVESPLIKHFTELSLGSNQEMKTAPQLKRHSSAKSLSEDGTEHSFQSEFWRRHSKPNQCGGHLGVREASMTR